MARAKVHFVKKARKSNKRFGVKKGQSYWWWKFNYGGKIISRHDPKVSHVVRLTEHESNVQSFEERIDSFENGDHYGEDNKDGLIENIQEYKYELEERLSNMPEQLQESHVLNEMIEQVDELLDRANDINEDEQ